MAAMTTDLRELSQEELHRLGQMDGTRVLSVYLRLDLPEAPTARARESELEARMDEAEKHLWEKVEGAGEMRALGACVERTRRLLDGVDTSDPSLHAIAIFCEDGGEPVAYALRRRPDFNLAADFRAGPVLEPLIEALPGPSWGVAVVSRNRSRVLSGTETGLVEVGEVEDPRRVCDLLFALHRRRPFERLAIIGVPETWPLVESSLHPYLRERLAGHLDVDVERASAGEVLDRLRELMAEDRRHRQHLAFERLEEGLGTGSAAVAGIEEVARAVEAQRVETLLIEPARDGTRVEAAIEGALAQSAEVLSIEGGALDRYGGVAALLRC
jgi:peptide chain release factor subunit 1